MRTRQIMSSDVKLLAPDTPITEASEQMRHYRIRHLPVVDARGVLVGMVSLGDIRQAALSSVAGHIVAYERRNHLAHAPVSQIMHQPVHFATPDTLVQEVAGTMRRLRVGALPVVEDETVVGIVSEFDLLKVIEHLPSDQLAEALPGE